MERNRRLAAEAGALVAARLETEVGGSFETAGSMASVRLPISRESKRSEAVAVRRTLYAVGMDSPVHPLAGGMWLRLSAYAYNEIEDYERLAERLPAALAKLGD